MKTDHTNFVGAIDVFVIKSYYIFVECDIPMSHPLGPVANVPRIKFA